MCPGIVCFTENLAQIELHFEHLEIVFHLSTFCSAFTVNTSVWKASLAGLLSLSKLLNAQSIVNWNTLTYVLIILQALQRVQGKRQD